MPAIETSRRLPAELALVKTALMAPADPPEKVFLEHRALIAKLAASVCRRNRCRPEEAEDFLSIVWEKMIADDYAVFRNFRATSKLPTFLTIVVANCFKDFRNKSWGKYRTSAEALKLGGCAILLDQLLRRDGLTFDEACQVIIQSQKVAISRKELERIAARLPKKPPRKLEGEEALEGLSSGDSGPEALALRSDAARQRRHVKSVLRALLDDLPAEDRLLLKLRVIEGFQVVEIARRLRLDAKQLYRRIERILKGLRRSLETEGIGWNVVLELLDSGLREE